MDPHLDAIVAFIIHYGYFVILPIAIIEGPIISVISGFLVAQGYFDGVLMYIVLIIGDLVGDLGYYALGRFGHRIARSRIGKKIGIKDHHLDKLTGHFTTHSGKTLLIGKFTHSLGLVILTGAGIAKMPVWKFLWYNFIGTLPKSLALILLGYYVGYAFHKIDSIMDKVIFIIGIVLTAAIATYLIVHYFKQRKKNHA